MADSDDKKETTSLVVRNPSGEGVREVLKGPDGRFVKKPRRQITTLEITRLGRKLMSMPVPEKIDKRTANRFQKLFMTLYDIATNPLALTDAKFAGASVQAAKELMLRVGGKPAVSDEEIDAMQKQSGIRVIVLTAPELMYKNIIEEQKEVKQLKPSFIDVEVITNEVPK